MTIHVVIYATYLIYVIQKTRYIIIAHIFVCKTSYELGVDLLNVYSTIVPCSPI